MFSHSTFIAHLESVLMCSLHWLGTSVRALWIARSSAVLLDCCMFRPIGAAVFRGSSGPNHTPSLAWVFASPFLLQDPSVYTTMSSGFVLAASLVAWVLDLLYVLLRILKFSCMSPVEVILGLKNFTLSGFLIAYLLATLVSLWVGSLFVGGVACGLNFGGRRFIGLFASL